MNACGVDIDANQKFQRRIGILKNYLNKVKIVRVCDSIISLSIIMNSSLYIFEIPILTVTSMVSYMISKWGSPI